MTQRYQNLECYDHETCLDCISHLHLFVPLPATLSGFFLVWSSPSDHRLTHVWDSGFLQTAPASSGRTMSDNPGGKEGTTMSHYNIKYTYIQNILSEQNIMQLVVYRLIVNSFRNVCVCRTWRNWSLIGYLLSFWISILLIVILNNCSCLEFNDGHDS